MQETRDQAHWTASPRLASGIESSLTLTSQKVTIVAHGCEALLSPATSVPVL